MATPFRLYAPSSAIAVYDNDDLRTLANNTSLVQASAFDNSTGLDLLGDFLVALQYNSVSGISAGTKVADVYLMPAIDGTNYPSQAGSPSVPQKSFLIGSLESRAPSTSALEYLGISGIPLYPGLQKIVFANVCGQALHSSANMPGTLRVYQLQGS